MELNNCSRILMNTVREEETERAETWFDTLEAKGIQLTEKQRSEIAEKINEKMSYEPSIGFFGKTGAGKSSLCNALFGQDVCAIDDVAACTRDPQSVLLNMGSNGIKLIDVPGVGENEQQDEACRALYSELLPKLDMVLWLVKADDRAMAADRAFYDEIVRSAVEDGKPVFIVLTQVDKIEPCREWDMEAREPGTAQFRNIHRKVELLAEEFGLRSNQIIPVCAEEGYNLTKLVDEMVFALPAQQNYAVFKAVNKEFCSDSAAECAKTSFFEMVGEIFHSVFFSTGLAISSIGDAIHDWWVDHRPSWWPV